MVDKYIKADYSDKEAMLEICQKEKMEGIVSCAHEFGMITTSNISEKMRWNGHD